MRFRGFSLIELMVVMAIVAFAVAIVVPNLGHAIGSQQYKNSMREMLLLMRSVREQAQQDSRTTELWLNVEEKTFGKSTDKKSFHLPANTKIAFETFEQGLKTDSTGVVRFYPDGTSSGGEITTDYDGLAMTLRVSWITGRIQLL